MDLKKGQEMVKSDREKVMEACCTPSISTYFNTLLSKCSLAKSETSLQTIIMAVTHAASMPKGTNFDNTDRLGKSDRSTKIGDAMRIQIR